MDKFFAIKIAFSLLRMYLSTRSRSDDVKFERYKEQGTDYKKLGRLSAAMKFYKRALNHAGKPRQKKEIWQLIVYLQTDRALASHNQYYRNSGSKMKYTAPDGTEHFWFFHGTEPPYTEPPYYNEPPREEILK